MNATLLKTFNLVVSLALSVSMLPSVAFAHEGSPSLNEAISESNDSLIDDDASLDDDVVPPTDDALDDEERNDNDDSDDGLTDSIQDSFESIDELEEAEEDDEGDAPGFDFDSIDESTLYSSNVELEIFKDADEKNVKIKAYGGSFARASNASFAVWSKQDGQDDLIWYGATKNSNNEWVATVSISNHKTAGEYNVHAYATVDGANRCLSTGGFNVSSPTATVQILPQTQDQIGRATFTVQANISSISGVKRVQAATWSQANGQDDLVWYTMQDKGSNIYEVEVPCASDKRDQGWYSSHVYLETQNGIFTYVAKCEGNVKLGEAFLEVSDSALTNEMSVTIKAYGGSFARASNASFAVWSKQDGQDDLIWYGATKNSNNEWVATVSISNHKTAGEYNVHAYATVDGANRCIDVSGFSISAPSGGTISTVNFENGSFSVRVSDVVSPSGLSAVFVPAWSEVNWNDDVYWHSGEKMSDGSWMVTINASDHLGQDGNYVCHVYVNSGNGIQKYIGAIEADMSVMNYVFTTGTIGSGGRSVYIKNPYATGVMQVPTWSTEGGQDDVVWYEGSYVGDNLYRANISCDNFFHAGDAVSHVYMGGSFAGSTSFWVSADEILPAPYRYMNQVVQNYGSRTSYFLAVDTSNCFVGVYTGSAGNWSCIYRFQCSPGKPSTPTVKGLYTVGSRGYSFGSGYTCYYWTQFYHDYLFHSVLYNQGTFTIQDGRLGQQLSHGCVRLAIDHAKWIYDTIPTGTQVYVY